MGSFDVSLGFDSADLLKQVSRKGIITFRDPQDLYSSSNTWPKAAPAPNPPSPLATEVSIGRALDAAFFEAAFLGADFRFGADFFARALARRAGFRAVFFFADFFAAFRLGAFFFPAFLLFAARVFFRFFAIIASLKIYLMLD